MELTGHIRNGVVVFDAAPPLPLPDGTAVTVTVPATPPPYGGLRPPVPLVRSDQPGTWTLTNDMIADFFEEEDIEAMRRIGALPPENNAAPLPAAPDDESRIPIAACGIAENPQAKQRVQVPLVRTSAPGTVDLTSDMIAEIIRQDDIDSMMGAAHVPS